ncbi:MAG: hypothetical protein K6F26_05660 [Lachnospiraceae bacterium]|jgi:hypothetical protein|nr:hypothetical protein [Lachnospiraceae bacterium]MBR7000659.1 hypothetical protein [Lachnospiraceae bacterium]MCR5531321.1 hypothetical protein [Lachnospiraceae bacterium]
MGLFDSILKRTGEAITRQVVNQAERKAVNQVAGEVNQAVNQAVKNYTMLTREFTYNALPKTLEELKALQVSPQDFFETAALTVLALNVYEENPDECIRMMDWLNGPDAVAVIDQQLIRNQFMESAKYTVKSYFKGATPQNNYTPELPYRITVHDNPYSYDTRNEGYVSLYIPSGGADNDRKVTLRTKPSTGEWFIHTWQGLLMGIRPANEANPWA